MKCSKCNRNRHIFVYIFKPLTLTEHVPLHNSHDRSYVRQDTVLPTVYSWCTAGPAVRGAAPGKPALKAPLGSSILRCPAEPPPEVLLHIRRAWNQSQPANKRRVSLCSPFYLSLLSLPLDYSTEFRLWGTAVDFNPEQQSGIHWGLWTREQIWKQDGGDKGVKQHTHHTHWHTQTYRKHTTCVCVWGGEFGLRVLVITSQSL